MIKIVINVGVGRLSQNPQFEDKILPEIIKELSVVSGQRPKTIGAKKSIAGFKIRTGQIIGIVATLRGKRMKDFLSRLINIVLPRIKDFRGIPLENIDNDGNLNIGIREQFVFPEILPELSKVNFGIQVTFVINSRNKEEAVDFYRSIGMPLKNKSK